MTQPRPVHWYLAVCQECTPLLPMPFTDSRARDRWAGQHAEGTGHPVVSTEEFR